MKNKRVRIKLFGIMITFSIMLMISVIPDNVLAVVNPCRVIREIGECDKEFFYRDERIDWENLNEICERKSENIKFK